ncbi:hypothetical protein CYMTET_38169 [Cymbomonas tetramitiformis]|uniref:Uncharacterized protein n=1 Tax=Cymbomonas tetramitiformis TaxID=36881 RepID=A0AAE0F6U2_9CHLO|nr:hypothetical protein CYMTET_38169 [Cymbomonas tetramitiformis]
MIDVATPLPMTDVHLGAAMLAPGTAARKVEEESKVVRARTRTWQFHGMTGEVGPSARICACVAGRGADYLTRPDAGPSEGGSGAAQAWRAEVSVGAGEPSQATSSEHPRVAQLPGGNWWGTGGEVMRRVLSLMRVERCPVRGRRLVEEDATEEDEVNDEDEATEEEAEQTYLERRLWTDMVGDVDFLMEPAQYGQEVDLVDGSGWAPRSLADIPEEEEAEEAEEAEEEGGGGGGGDIDGGRGKQARILGAWG